MTMRKFFDYMTDELHTKLSDWAVASPDARVVVRRTLPGSNTIIIDISEPRPSNADRFVVEYRKDMLPATITAKAGTLTTTVHEATFDSAEALQRWMLESVQLCNF